MRYLKLLLIIVLAFCVFVSTVTVFASKSKAEAFYKQAEDYAAQGQWDLAADAYAQSAKEYAKYQDVQAKLESARGQAANMLIERGDEAKAKERFDEALADYQKALTYKPTSIEAKSRYDQLSQEMVVKYYNRGRAYESQNLWAEAFKEYEKAYAINPNYSDLADCYRRAKVKVQGDASLRAILFFVNRDTKFKIESPLIQALQSQLVELSTKNNRHFAMIDQKKVQGVIAEQAGSLGDNYNDALALDLGRILAANEVIIGEILPDGKNKVKITAKLLKVPEGTSLKEAKFTYRIPEQIDLEKEALKVAKELAEKLD